MAEIAVLYVGSDMGWQRLYQRKGPEVDLDGERTGIEVKTGDNGMRYAKFQFIKKIGKYCITPWKMVLLTCHACKKSHEQLKTVEQRSS